MKPDFSKKQLLISFSGSIVLSDGTGTHTPTGGEFVAFSGIWIYDTIGASQPGDFCKTFSVDFFDVLPVDYFKKSEPIF